MTSRGCVFSNSQHLEVQNAPQCSGHCGTIRCGVLTIYKSILFLAPPHLPKKKCFGETDPEICLDFFCNPVPPEAKAQRAGVKTSPKCPVSPPAGETGQGECQLHLITPSGDLTWDWSSVCEWGDGNYREKPTAYSFTAYNEHSGSCVWPGKETTQADTEFLSGTGHHLQGRHRTEVWRVG